MIEEMKSGGRRTDARSVSFLVRLQRAYPIKAPQGRTTNNALLNENRRYSKRLIISCDFMEITGSDL